MRLDAPPEGRGRPSRVRALETGGVGAMLVIRRELRRPGAPEGRTELGRG